MSAYALTPLAKADIFDIWRHIAEGSEENAKGESPPTQGRRWCCTTR
jgi:plasmid stabilization system protein ParE